MKPLVASLAALLFVAGCGGWEGGKTPGTQTVLQIKAWPNGKDRGAAREWKLYCERSGGTLPAPAKACEQLFALDEPFATTSGDAVCTEIYGGPAVAEVEGLYRGETVNARFTRTDGCEIDRWDRHAFLFPVRPAGLGHRVVTQSKSRVVIGSGTCLILSRDRAVGVEGRSHGYRERAAEAACG